jgi:hypothetical protein
MTWQTATYRLTSDCAMIVHNGQIADPLNRWAKAIRAISGKRKKTDADYEEMARLEFLASLYIGPDGPVIPARNIDAMVIAAAKKSRKGDLAKSGVYCQTDAAMEYDGPREANALWADERFRHTALLRVQTARVVRTRPIFHAWQAIVVLQVEDSVVDLAQVDGWMFDGGRLIGLGDWRPQYGRFSVTVLSKEETAAKTSVRAV